MCFGTGATMADNTFGTDYFRGWVRSKFGIDVPNEDIQGKPLEEIRVRFFKVQEEALKPESINKEVDAILRDNASPQTIAQRWQERYGMKVDPKEFDPKTALTAKGTAETDQDGDSKITSRDILQRRIRGVYRHELTQLEQYVLLQIFDQSWKDHLYAMDMLCGGIGLQAFAEKDPRIAFKREGYRFFEEMMAGIRDKVTGIIFRVYVQGEVKQKSSYAKAQAQMTSSENYDVGADVRASGDIPVTAAAEESKAATTTLTRPIVRDQPKLGRNDPCPQGSGKKYKQCCGNFKDDGSCDGTGKTR